MLSKWILGNNVRNRSEMQKRIEMQEKSEMPVLKFTLTVLAFAGCWQPTSWTSIFRHIIYNAYTVLIVFTLYTFSMTQVLELILHVNDADTIGDALFNIIISLLACYKTVIMRLNNDGIRMLINNLTEMPFKPLDLNEIIIRRKFDKRITNNTLIYVVLIIISAIYMILLSLFTDFKNGTLMYKAWLPFDYSISALFYLAYIHQILSFIFIGIVHPGTDNFICGLLLHACCQLEILEYRITNIANGRESLRNCVRHHLCIFEYAYTLNERFSKIIPGEFIMIMVVMCYELIHMATTSSSSTTYVQDMMSVACTLAAIFYYCWFGNEIKLKSLQLSDNIWYKMEWTILSDNVKKGLIMIMNRATIPIEFSNSYLMPMNLDSFVMVLKTSYSLFNLVKQSQK